MKEASSKEKEYHYHYIKNIRNLLNKNDNLKTAIVLNFNRHSPIWTTEEQSKEAFASFFEFS